MKNSIKTWIISATFATMPLNVNGNSFENYNKNLRIDEINTSLFENLKKTEPSLIADKECINVIIVDPKVIDDAVMNYFDEEVKMFKISQKARDRISLLLRNYLATHSVLKIWSDWNLIFEIDNKKDFSLMVKQFVNIILDDMPFLVRKIIIPLFLWWNDAIQQKLDNLDITAYEMKEKQYKDVIFDNVAGIVKRVAISVKWNMKIGKFYDSVSSYYPNQNSNNIRIELDKLWLKDQDIKNLKYPFK